MATRKRTKPRNRMDDRQARPTNHKGAYLTDRPMKRLNQASGLMEEFEALANEGERLQLRLNYLRMCRPRFGCERLYEYILSRYEEEIDDMPRRLSALRARMERAGIRV